MRTRLPKYDHAKLPVSYCLCPTRQSKNRYKHKKSSLPTILLESTSEGKAVRDFSLMDEVLDKEFVKGSEFFLTNDFAELVGLRVPPNFHAPFAPVCFHSL